MTTAWLDQLDAQLADEEGTRLKPYIDTSGKITIGRGRNLTDKGISKTEATMLYVNDRNDALADAAKLSYWSKLDPIRQLAIADLVFNLGLSKFRLFVQFNSLMARGQYVPAGHDLANTLWAHEVSITRVNRIVSQILQGPAWQA